VRASGQTGAPGTEALMRSQLAGVGIDVGGTATRALVVDGEGHRLGVGRAGGANPTAYRGQAWELSVAGALRQALDEAGRPEVGSLVVGLAGGEAGLDAAASQVLAELMAQELGPGCRVEITGDVVVAFSAATASPDGTVLVAGTGAVAAAVRGRVPVRLVDGYGWLVGDLGSGFWLGREAARAALAALDARRGSATALLPTVVADVLGREGAADRDHISRRDLLRALYSRRPIELARLAPCVTRCAAGGDRVATRICRQAARHLVSAVKAIRPRGERTPLVLAGGVAAGDHMIAELVHLDLEALWPGCLCRGADPVVGAARLAASHLSGRPAPKGCRLSDPVRGSSR
jgi:glucosamine kinase